MDASLQSTLSTIRDAAEKRRDLVVSLWQELHRIPEPAFGEVKTTGFIRDFLAARGVELQGNPRRTGGLATVGPGRPRVLLRADIDGLPVLEKNRETFASEHPGFMHACGHDAHAAMLLAALDAVTSGDVVLDAAVTFFFQPAEEGAGGCRAFLERGLLEDHPVRAAFALHVWPGMATGRVGLSPGPVMAGMDHVKLRITGRGGHCAYPEKCVDPIVIAAQTVVALQTLVSRTTDPRRAAVLSLGMLQAGTAPNVIPDTADAEGSIRYFDEETRRTLTEGIERVATGVAEGLGGSCETRVIPGYPSTRNDPGETARLAEALKMLFGEEKVQPANVTMGSEDMSFLLDKVPGCYMQLGAAPDPASAPPLHSGHFLPDPACFPMGVAAFLTAACVLGRGEAP